MTDADQIIAKLGLHPHPEGGWYRQTWVGPEVNGRPCATAIYFLLRNGEASHWHRVDADEIWHWHAGSPLWLMMGKDTAWAHRLGPNVLQGEEPQILVPKGWWQATSTPHSWTLVSCTVSPGFRFDGFELAPPAFDLPRAERM